EWPTAAPATARCPRTTSTAAESGTATPASAGSRSTRTGSRARPAPGRSRPATGMAFSATGSWSHDRRRCARQQRHRARAVLVIRLWRASLVDIAAITAASLVEIGRSLLELLVKDDEPNDLGGDD